MKLFSTVICLLLTGLTSAASGDELSQRDQLRIAVQKICPISGKRLGEHGAPIRAKVGEESVFLCCDACLKAKVNPEHWATIHANIAKAQGICPVMKRPLPQNAASTIVNGQVVFVCCPPCSKKIAADPSSCLRQIDDRYTIWQREEAKGKRD